MCVDSTDSISETKQVPVTAGGMPILLRGLSHQRHKDLLASRGSLPALEVQQTTEQVLSNSLPTLLLIPHISSGPKLKPQG